MKSYAEFLRRLCHELAIVKKDFCGRKAVGLQDKLALEILNLIERMAVAVLTLFAVATGAGGDWSFDMLFPPFLLSQHRASYRG